MDLGESGKVVGISWDQNNGYLAVLIESGDVLLFTESDNGQMIQLPNNNEKIEEENNN